MRKRGGLIWILVTTVAAVTGSCDRVEPEPMRDGPLENTFYDGGMIMVRPNAYVDRWAGSFSSFPLCAEPPEVEVSIVDVRALEVIGEVLDLQVFVATPRPNRPEVGSTFISQVGRAPYFEQEYVEDGERSAEYLAQRYEIHDLAEPVSIDGSCLTPQHKPQLILTFDSDQTGGAIRSWEVHYESDGELFTSGPIHFEAGLCGNHPELAEHCAGTRGVRSSHY